MRTLLICLAMLIALPALAADWATYTNKRYGASADVPPGFEALGPEQPNGDGQTFRSGGALLVVFGASTGGDFEAHVRERIAFEESYYGWKITNTSIAPDWATYTASNGARQLHVRAELSCGGRHSVNTRFESNGGYAREIARIERSLMAAPAPGC